MSILVLNAGSSGLKAAIFGEKDLNLLWKTSVAWGAAVASAFDQIFSELRKSRSAIADPVTAVGHRVVHGGVSFWESVNISEQVKREILNVAELAPLHNRSALAVITRAQVVYPAVPHVAMFDTAYYHGLPPRQYVYPVPYDWYDRWGVRRFGFHGISHQACAERAGEIVNRNDLRVVSCHLGQGCSATASRGGRAVSTTMGFTPLEGLMMGTRSGSIDPGILIYLQNKMKVSLEALESALNDDSGIKGVSGVSSSVQTVEAAAQSGNNRCRLALDMFADRVRSAIGSLAVTMGGIDALVFTGGVGENSAAIRAEVCRGLECLGIELDTSRNAQAADGGVGRLGAGVNIVVIPAGEEHAIAGEVRRLCRRQP